jgi:hypothetical protein
MGIRGVAVAVSVALAVMAPSGCGGGHEKTPVIGVENPFRTTPSPHDTTLHLVADVDDCSDAAGEVVGEKVRETQTEVIVEARMHVSDVNPLECEIRTVRDYFTIQLKRPLGQRQVIDNAGGKGTVIWSPQVREALLRRLAIRSSDAEAAIRSKFPAAEHPNCGRGHGKGFSCTVRVPSRERPVSIFVWIRPGPKLKVSPGEKLPPELRTCGSSRAYSVC